MAIISTTKETLVQLQRDLQGTEGMSEGEIGLLLQQRQEKILGEIIDKRRNPQEGKGNLIQFPSGQKI